MSTTTRMDRRTFLKVGSGAGASLVIGAFLSACRPALPETPAPAATVTVPPAATATAAPMPTAAPVEPLVPNVYLEIDGGGVVTVIVPRCELGQGVRTALAMLAAEELSVDWQSVHVKTGDARADYGSQITGGSESIQTCYMAMRNAGAYARELLVTAAAQAWGVTPETCTVASGCVEHTATGQRLAYGALVSAAAQLGKPARTVAQLKQPADFTLVGTRVAAIDGPAFATGRAVFGLDVRVPGMLYAAIARCPVFGGKVAGLDASKALAVAGVLSVVQIDRGVAVVAGSTWAALQGRRALEVQWDEGPHGQLDSAAVRAQLAELIDAAKRALPAATGSTIEAVYELPYLAHATMEPPNATADVRADACEVWAPTQHPQGVQRRANAVSGKPAQVHVPLAGGAFGRRLEVDYAEEAVQVSKAVGAPVQVVWTRDDCVQHDFYRAASLHWLRAGIDEAGKPVGWRHLIAAQAITGYMPSGGDALLAGAQNTGYKFGHPAQALVANLPVPTGYWRAVYNTQNGFVKESFVDELAVAAGQDPYEFRRAWLPDRQRAVLDLAAEKAGWGGTLPAGKGRGIAFHSTWNVSPVAQVAEVSVGADGRVRVERVVCAIDCGLAVNPDAIEAQMEGGIVLGLTAALKGEITLKDGRVQQSNFHDYPLLRMDEMQRVEVYIVPSTQNPTGVGEMGVPPIAPAVCNAVYAATGKRIRSLPIRLS